MKHSSHKKDKGNTVKSSFVLALSFVFLSGLLACSNLGSNNNSHTSSSPTSSDPSTTTKSASSKRLAWDIGSKLSLAALGHGRGASESAVGGVMGKANDMARELDVEIPSLPENTGDTTKDSAAALNYLMRTAGDSIAKKLKDKHSEEHAALFEMALKSNMLMMLYSPDDSMGRSIAGVIKDRGAKAGLSESLWQPVVDKIEEKASFEEVKTAVSKMHKDISEYLGSIN